MVPSVARTDNNIRICCPLRTASVTALSSTASRAGREPGMIWIRVLRLWIAALRRVSWHQTHGGAVAVPQSTEAEAVIPALIAKM
jgi:hypothetical protein